LRLERAEGSRLAWAFTLSLALHLLTFGGYQMGQKYGLWERLPWSSWLKSSKLLAQILRQPQAQAPRQEELPLVFVEVSPEQATPEPPKEAKYYSSKNSLAANPEPERQTDVPKIDGSNTELVKTEDVPRNQFTPLQPTPPPLPQTKEPQEEVKAASTEKPGDLTLAKPDPEPKKDEGKAEKSRPKTVEEAKARLQDNRLAGKKMKQEGGVGRRLEIASLDAKATPYGEYDYELVRAIQNCWYGLLDQQGYASDYRGKVRLQFQLHYDGQISDLNVVENTAGPLPSFICERAVDKPKPYRKFTSDMRHLVGDVRHIQFTFFYD